MMAEGDDDMANKQKKMEEEMRKKKEVPPAPKLTIEKHLRTIYSSYENFTLDDIARQLDDVKKACPGWSDYWFTLDRESDYGSSDYPTIYVRGKRQETDEEYNDRMSQSKLLAQEETDRELRLFNELKKKYGNQ